MSYEKNLKRCLVYIEEHLKEKIEVRDLTDTAGYSLYHFCRVFKSVYGISAGAYLRQSQMDIAAQKIIKGKNITDTALFGGFDAPSGFSRDFRKRYG